MKSLLFLALLLYCANAISIVNTTYVRTSYTDGTLFGVDAVAFFIEFDEQVYVSGIRLDQLNTSLNPDQAPLFLLEQSNLVDLVCPCDNCAVSSSEDVYGFPECEATECLYSSDLTSLENMVLSATGSSYLTLAIPFYPVSDVLFYLGRYVLDNWIGVVTSDVLQKTIVVIKIFKVYSKGANRFIRLVPELITPESCSITLRNRRGVTYTDASNTSILFSNITSFVEKELPCNASELALQITETRQRLTDLGNQIIGGDTLLLVPPTLYYYQGTDAWIGCTRKINNLLVSITEDTTFIDTTDCPYDLASVNRITDPCCSFAASYDSCCRPRTVTTNVTVYTDFNEANINDSCTSPEKTKFVLLQYVKSLKEAIQCNVETSVAGLNDITQDAYDSYEEDCLKEIFGQVGITPPCQVDRDCWTSCNRNNFRCVVPWIKSEEPLIRCILSKADPIFARYYLNNYGVTFFDSTSTLANALRSTNFGLGCTGPTSFTLADTVNSTECLSDQGCSVFSQVALSGASCLNTSITRSPYCARCDVACYSATKYPIGTHIFVPFIFSSVCSIFGLPRNADNPYECSMASVSINPESMFDTRICSLAIKPDPEDSLYCRPRCYYGPADSLSACEAVNGTIGGQITIWETEGTGVCTFLNAIIHSDCEAIGALAPGDAFWYNGASLTLGFMDTQEECEAGGCSHDLLLNSSQCEITPGCTEKCPKCVNNGVGYGACYINTTQTTCNTTYNGIYLNDPFDTCWLKHLRDRKSCELYGYTFESCDELNITQCRQCSERQGTCPLLFAPKLGCRIKANAVCTNQTMCETHGGYCTDNIFLSTRTECAVDEIASARCAAVCLLDYTDPVTRTCDGSVDVGIGCIDDSISMPEDCTEAEGQWFRRALTEEECNAHPFYCYEDTFKTFTLKNQSECEACGGIYKRPFEWIPGQWTNGTGIDYIWTTASFGPVNSFNVSLNKTKLAEEFTTASINILSTQKVNNENCRLGTLLDNIETLSCACGDTKGSNCYASGLQYTFLASTIFFAGEAQRFSLSNFVLMSRATTVSIPTYSVTVQVFRSTDLSFLAPDSLGYGWLGDPQLSSSNYEYVRNDNGAIVGQVVGAGVLISFNETLKEPFELCLEIDPEIVIEEDYTEPDFGVVESNNIIVGAFQVYVYGSFICGNITESSEYYPINRQLDYENVTVSPTGVATTSEPTTGVPTTTAEPTTAEPTTAEPTTAEPTTAEPTTAEPTTGVPTTAEPTTAEPTTAEPTTGQVTTAEVTTGVVTTAETNLGGSIDPTTAVPTASSVSIEPVGPPPDDDNNLVVLWSVFGVAFFVAIVLIVGVVLKISLSSSISDIELQALTKEQ